MKKFLVILLIVVVCGIIGFSFWYGKTNEPEPQNEAASFTLDVSDFKKDLEGHETLTEWIKEYTDNITAYSGRTASIENELGDFMTQEQKEEMLALEERIKSVATIAEQREAMQRFDSILEEINNYRYTQEQALLAEQAAVQSQPQWQEPNYEGYTDSYGFKNQGVVYWNDTRYTWYSQNVLPGGGLDIPGRHVGGDDLIYDGDGYIVVASSDHAYGTTVETPFGQGKVYDTGCDSGTIDIYTNY